MAHVLIIMKWFPEPSCLPAPDSSTPHPHFPSLWACLLQACGSKSSSGNNHAPSSCGLCLAHPLSSESPALSKPESGSQYPVLLTAGRFQLWLEPWHCYLPLGHSLVLSSAKDPMKNSHSNRMRFHSRAPFTHSRLTFMWNMLLGRASNFIHLLLRKMPSFHPRCVWLQAVVLG